MKIFLLCGLVGFIVMIIGAIEDDYKEECIGVALCLISIIIIMHANTKVTKKEVIEASKIQVDTLIKDKTDTTYIITYQKMNK